MAAPDPNARSTEGGTSRANEVLDRAHNLIEKCIQLYMDRDETADTIESHAAIDRRITHMVWDGLARSNQEFFRNYYTRLASIRQNQLLEQQHRAMNFPTVPESGFRNTIMAAPDPNARSTEGGTSRANEVLDRAHNLIEKCIQLYMDRDETADTIESHAAIDRRITHMVWDGLARSNQEFFRNYYTRLASIRQNQLLEQQHRSMNFPTVPESGFRNTIMAAPDPNARSTEGGTSRANEVLDRAHNLIEKCIQLYMDRDETADTIESHAAIDCRITHMVWDGLARSNQEFFRNYYTRLALIRQNQLLEQQHRAMNVRTVPVEDQMSMSSPVQTPRRKRTTLEALTRARELGRLVDFSNKVKIRFRHREDVFAAFLETCSMCEKKGVEWVFGKLRDLFADHDDLIAEFAVIRSEFPAPIDGDEGRAKSATPVGSVGSEDVAGSASHLVASGSLARSSLESQGMRINAALDASHVPISQVPNLTAGGRQAANFGGPFQPSNLMAQSCSHLDIKPAVSVQENLSNSASGQDSPPADL